MTDERMSDAELHRRYYRWWTVLFGREFIKFGPVTVCWYRWSDGRRMLDATILGGEPVLHLGGPLN